MFRNNSLVSTNTAANPFNVLRNEMERLFRDISPDIDAIEPMGLTPKIEWRDNGDHCLLCVEVPGMNEKDINITLRENTLVIEGERKNESKKEENGMIQSEISYGSFYRAVPLTQDINTESISASYKNGMLEVKMDKNPGVAQKAKKIEINSSKPDVKAQQTKH